MKHDRPPGEPPRKALLIDVAIALFAAALAAALYWRLAGWDINIFDEGYVVNAAARIASGQVPYRDFQSNYAPGVFYIFVPLFHANGPDLFATRVVWLLCMSALAALVYLLARPALPRWAAAWAALFVILVSPPLHKIYFPLAVVAALLALRLLISGRGCLRPAAAGVITALAALWRQDVAVYAFVMAAATIALRPALSANRPEPLDERLSPRGALRWAGAFFLGAAAVLAPVGVYFAAKGALPAMLRQLLLDGMKDNRAMELAMPGLGRLFDPAISAREAMEVVLFYFPAAAALAAMAVVAAAARGGRLAARHALAAQWAFMALALHSQFIYRSDLMHVKQALVAPALCLAFLMGETAGAVGRAWASRHRVARTAAAVVALIILAGYSVALLSWGVGTDIVPAWAGLKRGTPLGEQRARVSVPAATRADVEGALDGIREFSAEGEPIFVAPFAPMMYFLSGRPNATRYDAVFPGLTSSPRAQREIIGDIERRGVRLVVLHDITWDGMQSRKFPRYAPEFERYLRENFAPARRSGLWVFYLRK